MEKPFPSWVFLGVLGCFILGVSIGSIKDFLPVVYPIGFILAIALMTSFGGSENFLRAGGVSLLLLALMAGIFLSQREVEKIRQVPQGQFEGKVWIAKNPQKKEDYQKIIIRPVEFSDSERASWQKGVKIKEKALLFASSELNFDYGEVIRVKCQLEAPENKYPKFNYRRFLAKSGIYQICRQSKITKTEEDNRGNLFFSFAFRVREKLEQKNNFLFPQPESAYLAGLLLGGEDRLPAKVAEDFRKTGTTHTVAVSGSNIAILIAGVMVGAVLVGFNRQQAFWVSLGVIIFFVIMIGAPASAVRAALMGGIVLWAAQNGRLAGSVRAALLAAVIMLLFSPFTLLYDAGFQLSFLATLGIIFIYAPLGEFSAIRNDFLELKSILLLTIAAQLGVTGLILYSFETFSPWSLLANLVILPAIPALMLGGFLVILISFGSLPVATFLSRPVYWGLHWEITFIQYLAQFPHASWEVKGFSWGWLIRYYALLIVLIGILKLIVARRLVSSR